MQQPPGSNALLRELSQRLREAERCVTEARWFRSVAKRRDGTSGARTRSGATTVSSSDQTVQLGLGLHRSTAHQKAVVGSR